LRITNSSRRPMSAGIRAPAVVLPSSLVDVERHTDLCCVIDHELVHLRRRDVASRALFALAAIPLWVHPLFWWLRARATLASEMIADDAAAVAVGRHAYARALVALSEDLQSLRAAPGLVPGTLRHRSELTRRIEMLVRKHDRLATRCTAAMRAVHLTAAVTAVALCSFVFGVRPVPAAASPPDGPLEAVTAATSGVTANAVSVDAADIGAIATDADEQARDPRRQVAQGQQRVRQERQQPPRQGQQQSSQQRQQQSPQQRQPQSVQQQEQEQQLRQRPAEQQRSVQEQQNVDAFYTQTLALAERAITLRSELEMASAELAHMERQMQVGAVDEIHLLRQRAGLQALQHRLEAVNILVESEIEATQLEIAEIERAIQVGQLDSSARARQVRLHGRLRVLQSVL
jgi:BlaR1 peptidase M56